MRTRLTLFVTLACLLFNNGCATDAVWDQYSSARKIPEYERVEAASIDDDRQFHVRLICEDGKARTFTADVQRAVKNGAQAALVLDASDNLPDSTVRLRLLTGTPGFANRKYPKDRSKLREDGGPIVYPDTVHLLGPDWIRVWITDEDDHPLQLIWLPQEGPTNAGLEIRTWALAVPAGLFDVVTFPIQFARAKLSGWK